MALQPESGTNVDRAATSPFLLRLFWRQNTSHNAWEFSVAPPADTTGIPDYSSLLPDNIRRQSVQIYTWPNCTLGELTTLFTSVLPNGVLPQPATGTRLVFKLIFPDTRATIGEGGRGKWIDKPLGSVVIGGGNAELQDEVVNGGVKDLEGDAEKTLAGARFVIGDYIACSIHPPGPDGRVQPPPAHMNRGPPPPRDHGVYGGPRGPPPPRGENGYGSGGYGRGNGGGYRGGYGGRGAGGGFGAPPPAGDWRRGERPPPPGGYGGREGYRGGRGRPY